MYIQEAVVISSMIGNDDVSINDESNIDDVLTTLVVINIIVSLLIAVNDIKSLNYFTIILTYF